MNWSQYFMTMAYLVAMKSNDPSTKVGAVIVGEDNAIVSTGYNGFPRGVRNTNERWSKDKKYLIVEHAERNAIYNATRIGVRLKGSTLYVTWIPCHECMKGIIQSGIKHVVIHKDNPKNANTDCMISLMLAEEAGVELEWWSGEIMRLEALIDGEKIVF